MQKFYKFFKTHIWIISVLILTVPSFYKMLQYGMYSTQDFHLFRLFEFDKCIQSGQLPCRWAPDAGLGYGEPLFNYYGQFSYAIGEIFHLLGASFIDSLKVLFILSLAVSGLSMFILAKKIWNNNYAALISSGLYIYAPYRSVNVWVRGALPEAFSFILFPLILYAIEKKSLKWFSFLLAILIITHNLSFLMFAPLMCVWLIYRRYWKGFLGILISLVLSAFYVIPVIFESKYVNLGSTVTGYFDYHNHFATLKQLFLLNFWGYGASNWGPKDDISLSIGYVQWGIALLVFIAFVLKREIFKQKEFLLLVGVGFAYIFLTHNKSTVVWELVNPMAYVQFPWRFLGMIVFCLSLAAGALTKILKTPRVLIIFPILAIILNFQFFKPDLWYPVGDNYYFQGVEWDRQRTASIGDYWPNFGHDIPETPSDGTYVNYFPGWESVLPPEGGLILAEGSKFTDTPVRKMGNMISLISLFTLGLVGFTYKKWTKKV